MTEIKVPRFRGRRVDKKYWGKPWVEGAWVEGACYKSSDGRVYIAPAEFSVGTLKDFFAIWVEVEPSSLGLSTGLFDRHGKEIFGSLEGSRGGDEVLCWLPHMPQSQRVRQEVMLWDGCFGVGDYPLKLIDKLFLEILGPAIDLRGGRER